MCQTGDPAKTPHTVKVRKASKTALLPLSQRVTCCRAHPGPSRRGAVLRTRISNRMSRRGGWVTL